jgi:hypothetical protein
MIGAGAVDAASASEGKCNIDKDRAAAERLAEEPADV